jgi:hypothetical protein
MKPILLTVCLLYISGVTVAQKRVEAWSRVSVTSLDWVPKSVIQLELQYRDQYLTRFQDMDQKTYSIRPWFRREIGEKGVYIQSSPIAYFFRATASNQKESSLNEWRVTQHIGYQLKNFPLEFRTGVEYRSFSGEINLNELRYRGRIQSVLRKRGQMQPKFSMEYFYRQGNEERMFDQFRALAGIGRSSEKLDFELGYQYHSRQNVLRQLSHSNIIYINLTPKI